MPRLILLAAILCCATSHADGPGDVSRVVDRGGHTLVAEPLYQARPRYSLMSLGIDGAAKVWMVEDGRRLYVDINANGDVTDDGPPIEPRDIWDESEPGSERTRRHFHYHLEAITPADGSRHTDFRLRRWNYGAEEDSYGLSLSVNGKTPMYAGWFGSFWSADPETAPMINFGGPVTPKMLRFKEFTVGSGMRRLSVAFTNPGAGEGAESRLGIDAIAADVAPTLKITWPSAEDSQPLRTSHRLFERCCYWEFYTYVFQVPSGVAAGVAKVSLELPTGAMPLPLATTEIEVPVIDRSESASH